MDRGELYFLLLDFGCGSWAFLRGVALHPNPEAPISTALEAILIPSIITGPSLESFGKGDCWHCHSQGLFQNVSP